MTEVLAPVSGAVQPLAQVDDPVFSAEMVGSGVAIVPPPGETTAIAPIAGTIVKALPHAFIVMGDDGAGVLVHLGIGTVKLEGEGFEILQHEKDTVAAGDEVTRWDPSVATAAGMDTTVLVCVMDSPAGSVTSDRIGSDVEAGTPVFTWDAGAPERG